MQIAGKAVPPAVPGSLDRESFADAQRRHRRAAHLFVVPVVLVGLVLTGPPLILFPLLFGLTVPALDVLRDDIRWQG